MTMPIYQVDAFTDRPFAGNPAAVCLLTEQKDDQWLQSVAAEMNLSETAFLMDEGKHHRLRWFTPRTEVDLCGHATLASAHVLWTEGKVPQGQEIQFQTKSGLLTATVAEGCIELDFPAEPQSEVQPPVGLLDALGTSATHVGKNRFDFLVEVESEGQLRDLAPDFVRLGQIEARGVIVTSRSSLPNFDFVSRFFAPWAGIDEDPVTGSAHCCLGPYWQSKLNKSILTGYQASERGGIVQVRVADARVILGGTAVTMLRGELVG